MEEVVIEVEVVVVVSFEGGEAFLLAESFDVASEKVLLEEWRRGDEEAVLVVALASRANPTSERSFSSSALPASSSARSSKNTIGCDKESPINAAKAVVIRLEASHTPSVKPIAVPIAHKIIQAAVQDEKIQAKVER